ncbi:MAG: hypothetical protein ABSC05_19575 [Candidatus Solibacter sp.]|jgi:hypothetical protein
MTALRRILPFARIAAWCGLPGLSAMVAFPQNLPDLYSDELHGDPPFLSEPGWRPLPSGSSLAGGQGQDGKAHEWFTSMGGGTLVLHMGPRPNRSWGGDPEAAPASFLNYEGLHGNKED